MLVITCHIVALETFHDLSTNLLTRLQELPDYSDIDAAYSILEEFPEPLTAYYLDNYSNYTVYYYSIDLSAEGIDALRTIIEHSRDGVLIVDKRFKIEEQKPDLGTKLNIQCIK